MTMCNLLTDGPSLKKRIAKTGCSKTYYPQKIPSEKKPQECHLKKLKRTMLIFSLWQPEWTKGYLEGKKAGPSDSIFKTYHLILEPALKTSKGSHYIFCGQYGLAPMDIKKYFMS